MTNSNDDLIETLSGVDTIVQIFVFHFESSILEIFHVSYHVIEADVKFLQQFVFLYTTQKIIPQNYTWRK